MKPVSFFFSLSKFMFLNTIEREIQEWFSDTSEFYRKRKQIAAIIEELLREKFMQSSKILSTLKFHEN